MSASMVDAITLERRGTPAALLGVDRLVNTTGRTMARAQGAPDYPVAVIPSDFAATDTVEGDKDVEAMAQATVSQVEAILLGKQP